MPKKSLDELRAILNAEKADALAATQANKLSDEREKAMNYYLGDLTQDLPVPDGRSTAVSNDVFDTIEGMMPDLMEIFTSGDEVVRFDPVGQDDVKGAEQETDYINHVFMQKNPGFLILYSFIKDALLSKVGIVKVAWEVETSESTETYYDITDEQLMKLLLEDNLEVLEHTAKSGNAGTDTDTDTDNAGSGAPAPAAS